MDNILSNISLAIALIFVIEGLLYAIFPAHIQKMMAMATHIPRDKFRSLGLVMMSFGLLFVWWLERF